MSEARKRKRVDNINEVDHLLEHRFETLSLEEKLEVKRLGPHHPRDIGISQTAGKNIRAFNVEWFAKKKWLTASIQKKALFCFPCLLFGGSGGEVTWSRTGYKDLKHLSERITKHESSNSHLDNAMKLGLFGRVNVAVQIDSAYRRGIDEHNRQVEENRYVLGRIITCIKLCGKCETALRGHDESADSLNPGIFHCIFETMCEGDARLQRHYDAQPVFKGTSSTIQNELLDCMYEVYRDEIAKQVDETSCVAVQADETTDVSCNSQMDSREQAESTSTKIAMTVKTNGLRHGHCPAFVRSFVFCFANARSASLRAMEECSGRSSAIRLTCGPV
ncbi:Zinc finger MYM-type protein 1 [Merluccius polli]|uniref:Zinc finger MYM-type protein 1 n=1 Tax=Merluccius polli TaxID=89951 RepID=A0AA47MYI3_MERPO|nr:Zinc finger MYM-type protein 1 [Merluccius polli]